LSYRPTTELGALSAALLADLERLRPGLAPEASEADIEKQCSTRADIRLPELYSEYQGEPDPDSQTQLALYRREIDQLLIPRYAKLASLQNQLERSQSRGALYNRLSYAALFFALGLFVVWAPFIPIWEKWLPFALAIIAPLLAPWLPNLHGALRERQHRLRLGLLTMDLDEAGKTLPLPPLGAAALPAKAADGNPATPAVTDSRGIAARAGGHKESNGNRA
jgi:hypothetical protein